MTNDTKDKKTKAPVKKDPSYFEAVGRRKNASARVRLHTIMDETMAVGDLTLKKGDIAVNDRPVESYFPGEVFKKMYFEPLRTTNTIGRFVITVHVSGGGLSGQIGAAVHGISRALCKVDEEKFRPILKKRGLLTRDPRKRERRKAGLAHSARAKKQSPKR